jgi:hypothetical protein
VRVPLSLLFEGDTIPQTFGKMFLIAGKAGTDEVMSTRESE